MGSVPQKSLSQAYFDQVYAANRDPWNFETSPYEAGKYAASLAMLPEARYGNALEVGCSIGVFTHMLAERCDSLLAVDVAERAMTEARRRCSAQPWVRFKMQHLPEQFPEGVFDLVTVCEVGYYWSSQDLLRSCRVIASHQLSGADLLLVHWTPEVQDYPLLGDTVHEVWLRQPWWQLMASQRHSTYRIDLLRRNQTNVV